MHCSFLPIWYSILEAFPRTGECRYYFLMYSRIQMFDIALYIWRGVSLSLSMCPDMPLNTLQSYTYIHCYKNYFLSTYVAICIIIYASSRAAISLYAIAISLHMSLLCVLRLSFYISFSNITENKIISHFLKLPAQVTSNNLMLSLSLCIRAS